MKTRLSNLALRFVSHPWAAVALGTVAAAGLLVALGMPADEALRMAGPMNSGTGGT